MHILVTKWPTFRYWWKGTSQGQGYSSPQRRCLPFLVSQNRETRPRTAGAAYLITSFTIMGHEGPKWRCPEMSGLETHW